MIAQPSKSHNNKHKNSWNTIRKYLLLAYVKANQVTEFHIPPNHRLSWTKYFFHLITPMPYSKHECGTQDINN